MKKQTFLICFENIDGIAVNFERWTFKSVKTCIKKTVKVIAYSTPDGYTRQQAVWTATIDEFKRLINNFY